MVILHDNKANLTSYSNILNISEHCARDGNIATVFTCIRQSERGEGESL